MTGYVSYDGIDCACPACGARVSDNNAGMTVLWRNQHGAKIRVFCWNCGRWTDRTITAKGETVYTFTPAIPDPIYAERVMFGIVAQNGIEGAQGDDGTDGGIQTRLEASSAVADATDSALVRILKARGVYNGHFVVQPPPLDTGARIAADYWFERMADKREGGK